MEETAVGDLTVADVAESRWGVRPEAAIERFDDPGWSYERQVDLPCPRCGGVLHTMRKPYESGGRTYRYVAVVCPRCPRTFTLADLGFKTHADLIKATPAPGAPANIGDTSVAGIAHAQWGVRPEPAVERYRQPGWQYLRETAVICPTCQKPLHSMWRVYHQQGTPRVQAAMVCPACPATFTTRQLKISRRSIVGDVRADLVADAFDATSEDRSVGVARAATAGSPQDGQAHTAGVAPGNNEFPLTGGECPSPPPAPGVQVRAVGAGQVSALLAGFTQQGRSRVKARGQGPQRPVAVTRPVEHRLLYWRKSCDVNLVLPSLPAGTDVRVIVPDSPAFDQVRDRLAASGVACRAIKHWVEEEIVSTVGPDGEHAELSVMAALAEVGGLTRDWGSSTPAEPAYDARDAFEKIWDAHDDVLLDHHPLPVPAAEVVPAPWLPYLPFDTLNPAQAQAAPVVLASAEHIIATAPTGAGKTLVGMLATLWAILGEGRKAAWLVPQRSLTEELGRELETWHAQGLRVERLSGEYSTDLEKVREADLWVATTEKFEAICRASSLQAALAEVGCLVVDEIHLLGDPVRGPLLEALLARVRGAGSPVRIVGLSATVSNAAEIAEWLHGQLVATTWRPSRLTWQLPMIPAFSDRATDANLRTRAAVDLAQRVTGDGGSVLIFCGTKPNVRSTALALATARGADVTGITIDDLDRLHRACASVGVGLHYKDWEFKREAEARFRARDWDVLVATTTVAAGVNLPARAVIVRDTRVGLDDLDIATAMQMFGRAGRVGAGETEGWAYLITTETERSAWQGALVDGYTVYSQIHASLPDHVLAEVLQGRITSTEEAEGWWLRTLSHHQGDDDSEPVIEAVDFLLEHGFLTENTRADNTTGLAVTDLGRVTARLMVDTRTAARLRTVVGQFPVPSDPDSAEDLLIHILALTVPELANAPVAEPQRPAVAAILKAGGRHERLGPATAVSGLGSSTSLVRGDLARAALLLVARSPRLFARPSRAVAGIPNSTLYPVLEQAPRYLAWLGAQGHLATIHPWVAIVAADLARRVRWRRCAPGRGAGRLLWMLEHMATPTHTDDLVPQWWNAATQRGITSPDWPHGTPPNGCKLDPHDYTSLRRIARLADHETGVRIGNIPAATVTLWTGAATATTQANGTTDFAYPHPTDNNTDTHTGAAVFTKRGDHKATGWLSHYATTHVGR